MTWFISDPNDKDSNELTDEELDGVAGGGDIPPKDDD
jgi:hypothetical protein